MSFPNVGAVPGGKPFEPFGKDSGNMLRRRKHGTTDRLALPHQHRRKGEIAETVRSAPGRDPRMARFIRILTAMARATKGALAVPFCLIHGPICRPQQRSSAVVPSCGVVALPMLIPTCKDTWSRSNGSEMRSMMRRATVAASTGEIAGSSMTNSSPPIRQKNRYRERFRVSGLRRQSGRRRPRHARIRR